MGLLSLLAGILVLVLGIWGANTFVRTNPAHLAGRIYLSGAGLAFVAAIALTGVGRPALAMPLVFLGLALWRKYKQNQPIRKASGRSSRVRTHMIEMHLDHDSGAMEGRVLSGKHSGRALRDLDLGQLADLWHEAAGDPDTRALLEAYLDRRSPSWRQHREADAEPRGRGAAGDGPMSADEAYQILGLQPNAGAEEIRGAYRALMKKVHPDQGGSAYLAARVNQAKDFLLGRHG
ncbi:molecular chaperone DnaJ [Agaricicola taiwanensis]|uniref:Molecular chaperone DnaJ n=1 Tax=Agaricicola taiwanensis TaxID=591372 RepID=A0A8J2YJG6_9RHOB|nr:DnaJ domain-containing protein [Agaricicola taiwanensis]GGE47361.1 molecular chaperone DnaJ [Agaricicola taiwanensis]